MVNPDIRRLQFLNDLIAQTLDVINQRSWVGGLSHTPYADINNLYQLSQLGNVPLTQPQSVGMGLGHTPFQSAVPNVFGNLVGQGLGYGQNIPANVFGGLAHTPLAWQTPYAQQVGLGLGYGQNIPANVFGGLAHTPFPWQTPYAQQVGQGLGYGQNIPANVFGGLTHTPFQSAVPNVLGNLVGQGQGYGQNIPANILGGLTHTPFPWQTPQYGVGVAVGLPFQNPWMITQNRFGYPQF